MNQISFYFLNMKKWSNDTNMSKFDLTKSKGLKLSPK
jgi:hypothetical protein